MNPRVAAMEILLKLLVLGEDSAAELHSLNMQALRLKEHVIFGGLSNEDLAKVATPE